MPVYGGCDQALRQLEALTRHAAQTARLDLYFVLHFEQVVIDKCARQGEFLQDLLHLLIHIDRVQVQVVLHVLPAGEFVLKVLEGDLG